MCQCSLVAIRKNNLANSSKQEFLLGGYQGLRKSSEEEGLKLSLPKLAVWARNAEVVSLWGPFDQAEFNKPQPSSRSLLCYSRGM